jgi:hypothetical protein
MDGLGDWTKKKQTCTVEEKQPSSRPLSLGTDDDDDFKLSKHDIEKGIPTTIEITKTFSSSSWDRSHSGESGDSDVGIVEFVIPQKSKEISQSVVADEDTSRCDPTTRDNTFFSLELLCCLMFVTAMVVMVGIMWKRSPGTLIDVDDE